MLIKLKILAIAFSSVLILSACTTTQPNSLANEKQAFNDALDSIYGIDSFYFSYCTPPPLLEALNAPRDEVVTIVNSAMLNFLECDLMHAGLIDQLREKNALTKRANKR